MTRLREPHTSTDPPRDRGPHPGRRGPGFNQHIAERLHLTEGHGQVPSGPVYLHQTGAWTPAPPRSPPPPPSVLHPALKPGAEPRRVSTLPEAHPRPSEGHSVSRDRRKRHGGLARFRTARWRRWRAICWRRESVNDTPSRITGSAKQLVEGCDAAGIPSFCARSRSLAPYRIRWWSTVTNFRGALGKGPVSTPLAPDGQRQFRDRRLHGRGAALAQVPAPRHASWAWAAHDGLPAVHRGRGSRGANIYSYRPGAFTEASETAGWLLASHAAVAFSSARTHAQLQEAIGTRHTIGEAMGIPSWAAAPHDRGPGLRRAATVLAGPQRKLRDVAPPGLRNQGGLP